jgi:hypothetical protein
LDITDAEESVEMAQHRDDKLNDVREYLISKTLSTREQRYAIWVKNLAEKCFLENDLVWYKSERLRCVYTIGQSHEIACRDDLPGRPARIKWH